MQIHQGEIMFSSLSNNNYVHYVESIAPDQLSNNQRKFLTNLNTKLSKIEVRIKEEVTKLITFGNAKVTDPNDYIDDFELSYYLTFILDENDPAYNDDDDNILVELRKHSKRVWSESNKNHNEFAGWHHPMSHEHHCWLYHCLYDHTELDWSNMLRIGSIWLDINVDFQKIISI